MKNSTSTLRNLIIGFFLFSLSLGSAESAPWKLETSITPEEGGTVSPVGLHADGAKVNVTITAKPGWFILRIGVAHSISDDLDRATSQVNNPTGSNFFTNITGAATMKSDVKITAVFRPLAPRLVTLPEDKPSYGYHNINIEEHTIADFGFTLYSYIQGLGPLTYEWSKNGAAIPGKSGTVPKGDPVSRDLSFGNIDPSFSGTYALAVKNDFGSASVSTKITVLPMFCTEYGDALPIVTNHVTLTNPMILALFTTYKDGHIFYTLDGTEPTLAGPEYHLSLGPIEIHDTKVLRAVAFSSDFATFGYLDPITFEKPATVTFSYRSTGVGTIQPQIAKVPKGTTVTFRAIPNPGSFFVSWDSPEMSDNPVITVRADADTTLRATFATPLSIKTEGAGTVEMEPKSDGYTPGTFVSLYPKPATGSYFVRWSGSGGTSPSLTLSAGIQQTQTALFAPLPSGKVSLTVISKGPGFVVDLATNVFSMGSTVDLEAKPYDGEKFLRWSGDASGTNALISLELGTSKIVYAEFENRPRLLINTNQRKVVVENYYGLGVVFDVFSSTNLKNWRQEFSKTNLGGFVFGDWKPTDSAGFFKAEQRER